MVSNVPNQPSDEITKIFSQASSSIVKGKISIRQKATDSMNTGKSIKDFAKIAVNNIKKALVEHSIKNKISVSNSLKTIDAQLNLFKKTILQNIKNNKNTELLTVSGKLFSGLRKYFITKNAEKQIAEVTKHLDNISSTLKHDKDIKAKNIKEMNADNKALGREMPLTQGHTRISAENKKTRGVEQQKKPELPPELSPEVLKELE